MEELERKEDESSLLRDLVRHAGWEHLRNVFYYGIQRRQDVLSDLPHMTKTAIQELGISPNDYENILRGEIRILKYIIKSPERLADDLEEELRESERESEE
jgi:hypothetical protein